MAIEKLSAFEYQAIEEYAANCPERDSLLAQLVMAERVSRDYTDVGFYARISVPTTAPKLDLTHWKIEDMPKGVHQRPAPAHLELQLANGPLARVALEFSRKRL